METGDDYFISLRILLKLLVLSLRFCSDKGTIWEDLSIFSSARPLFTFKLHLLKQFLNISLSLQSVSFKLQCEHTCRPSQLYFWSAGNCAIYVRNPFAHLFLLRASVFLHDSSFPQFIIFILEYSVPQTILPWAMAAASPQDYIEKLSVLPTTILEGRYRGVCVIERERESVQRCLCVHQDINVYFSNYSHQVCCSSLALHWLRTFWPPCHCPLQQEQTAGGPRWICIWMRLLFRWKETLLLYKIMNFNMLNNDHPKISSPTPWNLEILPYQERETLQI